MGDGSMTSIKSALSSLKPDDHVAIDCAPLYPGDITNEYLFTEKGDFLKSALKRAQSETNANFTLFFLDESEVEKAKSTFSQVPGLSFKLRPLSLKFASSQNDSMRFFGENFCKVILLTDLTRGEGSEDVFSVWGSVEKVGNHFIDCGMSLEELLEYNFRPTVTPRIVLIGGPLGKYFSWESVKSKTLDELAPHKKTIHFYGIDSDLASIKEEWLQFFIGDQCFSCLPCKQMRSRLSKRDDVTFKSEPLGYLCHLPHLYFEGQEMIKSMEEGRLDG